MEKLLGEYLSARKYWSYTGFPMHMQLGQWIIIMTGFYAFVLIDSEPEYIIPSYCKTYLYVAP